MTFRVDQLRSQIRQGIAFTNLFRVLLPAIDGVVTSGYSLNVLCKTAQMPGRQILTNERNYGMKRQKVAYGYAQEDVSLTFHLLSDYGVKEYFEAWMGQVVDFERGEVNYKKEYEKDVVIQQLKKDVIFDLNFDFDLPLGLNLTGDIVTPDQIAYTCRLENAFPTTMNAIDFSNEANQIGELNVQLSYTTWKGEYGFSINRLTQGFLPNLPF
jgi:hypothetical protein